jgi:hypothetical protein
MYITTEGAIDKNNVNTENKRRIKSFSYTTIFTLFFHIREEMTSANTQFLKQEIELLLTSKEYNTVKI